MQKNPSELIDETEGFRKIPISSHLSALAVRFSTVSVLAIQYGWLPGFIGLIPSTCS